MPLYTGGGKGGPEPLERKRCLSDITPSLLILISPIPPQDSTNEYSDIPIILTGMRKHQIKSGYYYIFWGLATISVVIGQVYVGSGYRQMVNSIEELTEEIKEVRN